MSSTLNIQFASTTEKVRAATETDCQAGSVSGGATGRKYQRGDNITEPDLSFIDNVVK